MRACAPHAHFQIALTLHLQERRAVTRRLLIEKHAYGEIDPSGRQALESWRCSSQLPLALQLQLQWQ
jgi:hypothetical protein